MAAGSHFEKSWQFIYFIFFSFKRYLLSCILLTSTDSFKIFHAGKCEVGHSKYMEMEI
jgi:hypothetical protein